MNIKFLVLGVFSSISFYSSVSFANSSDLSSAVKNYTYKDGEPYGLSQVYKVNSPDEGLPPYYIFMKLGIENAIPFVFNREGVPGKDEPYSRCNVVIKVKDKFLIPERKYKSGYAEDSEPCIGIDKLSIVKGNQDVEWYVANAIYQSESQSLDSSEEVYFYSDGNFCFSEGVTLKLSSKKININDLKKISVDEKYFQECAK